MLSKQTDPMLIHDLSKSYMDASSLRYPNLPYRSATSADSNPLQFNKEKQFYQVNSLDETNSLMDLSASIVSRYQTHKAVSERDY